MNKQDTAPNELNLQHIETIEHLLDRSIRLPGGFTIGLDGIIGLIPVVGDIATTGFSFVLLLTAIKHRIPYSIITLMLLYILVDFILGSIPIVGDLFDFAFRANVKNATLIRAYAQSPDTIKKRSRFMILSLMVFITALTGALFWLAFSLVSAIVGYIF